MSDRLRVVVAYLAACLAGLCLWGRPPFDPDLGWHLLGGSLTTDCVHALLGEASRSCTPLTHGDPINVFRTHWHNYHWFGQWLLFSLYTAGGHLALQVGLGILGGLFGILILAIARANSKATIESLLILTLAQLMLLNDVSSVRPQMFALFGLTLVVLILSVERRLTVELTVLAIITAILVNIHVYWVFVPFLWLVFRFGSPTKSSSEIVLGTIFLFSLGFLSPYGAFSPWFSGESPFLNYFLIWDYLQMPAELRSKITEMQSPFRTVGSVAALLLLTLALVSRYTSREIVAAKGGPAAIFAVMFALSVRAVKFLGSYAILSVPFLAGLIEKIEGGVGPQLLRWKRFPSAQLNLLRSTLLAALLIGVAIQAYRTLPNSTEINSQLNEYLPLAACRSLVKEIPAAVGPGHVITVATDFDTGGWCRWAAYQSDPSAPVRVTTDGRTQHVPVEHYLAGFDLYALREGWQATLAKWSPAAVLAPRSAPLGNLLFLLRGQWRAIFTDEHFAVFVPVVAVDSPGHSIK